MRAALALALCMAWLSALAGEAGFATRDIELKAEPRGAAAVTGTLQKGAKFEIVGEKGAWSQVKSGNAAGWALSFYVMKGEPAAQVGVGQRLGEVWTLGTDRRAETTATIGIRGLDEEQLKSAQFNEQELKRMEALAVPRAEGDAFAQKGNLAPQKVEYFPSANQK
jgi:hypothetical protein